MGQNRELEGMARRAQFVREYLVDLNAGAAALRVGLKAKGAGTRYLRDPRVRAELARQRNVLAERTEVTADRVVEELARVAFADLSRCYGSTGALLDVPQMPEATRRALAGVEVTEVLGGESAPGRATSKVKLLDKLRALELLGKRLGMWTDKLEVGGSVSINIAGIRKEGTDGGK